MIFSALKSVNNKGTLGAPYLPAGQMFLVLKLVCIRIEEYI